MIQLTSLAVVFAIGTAAPQRASAAAPQPAPELVPILERAGRYVLDYEQRFQNVAALETTTQWWRYAGDSTRSVEGAVPAGGVSDLCNVLSKQDGVDSASCQRETKADSVFVRLEGEPGLRTFRDVFEVNGAPVREHEPRLERIFAGEPIAAAARQARALTEQSDEAYDRGPRARREMGSPTLVLVLLRPDHQSRFAWTARGKRRFGNVEALEIAFDEVARPALVRSSDGGEAPASGRVWIDVSRGTVVRSELEFRVGERARARVTTEYRPERDLSLWVPVERREEYADVKGFAPVFGARTQARSEYSKFRRIPIPTPATKDSMTANDPAAAPANPELVELLRRAGEYVTGYEAGFADLLAEETYSQSVTPRVRLDKSANGGLLVAHGRKQTTRADLVFVRLAGEIPWASYRDVFELDGRKLRERDNALERLLSAPGGDREELSRKLLAASAVYNIGPVKRTVNLPTLPLVFLLPRNQGRFAFRLGERRTIESTEAVEVAFTETARPTLVSGARGANLPTSGRFWIHPSRGAVLRSEVEFDFGLEAEARVTTDYRPAPELAMWVPAEMREHYADVSGAKVQTFASRFEGIARYSRFRRFTVETQEHVAAPER